MIRQEWLIYWYSFVINFVYTGHFSKLDTYNSFKCRFNMKGYFNSISNREHRDHYSKIRISNHRLAIETGRFNKTPRNDRICLYCKNRSNPVIEDEKTCFTTLSTV